MIWFSGANKQATLDPAGQDASTGVTSMKAPLSSGAASQTSSTASNGATVMETPILNGDTPALVPGPDHDKAPASPPKAAHRTRCGGIALALGGGVARGWAHIGVMRAIDDFGLPVSMIAGTSIGALVGGCYLAGVLDDLEDFARSLTKTNILRYLDFSLRGTGLIAGSRLADRMEEHMAGVSIESLSKPFVAVATEIRTGHEIWMSDGPLVPAIRASYALPGVFAPVIHGGRELVDGAIVNPVPVSVCRAYEPDLVIAVNLNTQTVGRGTVVRASHYDPVEDAIENNPDSQVGAWMSFMGRGAESEQAQSRLGMTSVMIEAFNIIQDRIARARLAGDPPDFTVRPKLKNIGFIEFHKADQAIKVGYNEMMARLKDLESQGVLDTARQPA